MSEDIQHPLSDQEMDCPPIWAKIREVMKHEELHEKVAADVADRKRGDPEGISILVSAGSREAALQNAEIQAESQYPGRWWGRPLWIDVIDDPDEFGTGLWEVVLEDLGPRKRSR